MNTTTRTDAAQTIATITAYAAATANPHDPYPVIDNGDGTWSVWDHANNRWAERGGREDLGLRDALISRDQLVTGSHQILADADDIAPGAYLGRVRPNGNGGWIAERTRWDDLDADHDPLSVHLVIGTLTGPDAQDCAEQAVRDLYEHWKDCAAW